MWDLVLAVVSVLFAYSLYPTVVACIRERVVQMPYQTVVITSLGMCVIDAFYWTHGMTLAAITSGITAGAWLTLLVLKIRYK